MNQPDIQVRSDSKLLLFVRVLCYALLLTPLLFWRSLDFYLDSTKAFFVMGVSELLFVSYLWLLVKDSRWKPRWTVIFSAFFVFLAMLFLVSFTGSDLFLSFWSSTIRIGGLLMWLHLAVVFVVLSALFRTKQDWHRFFFFSTVIGVFVSLFFLYTQTDPSFFREFKSGSTTGNSTYFGAYLLFQLWMSLQLVVGGQTRHLKYYGLAVFVLFAVCVLLSTALAAKGVLFGGALFAGALVLLCTQRQHTGKRGIGAVMLLFLLGGFLYAWHALLFQPESAVRQTFVDLAGSARLTVLEISWNAFLDRPWLGFGLENFPKGFSAHFIPCFGAKPCGAEIWYDQAHNVALNMLVEGGVVLLAAYLFLFIASLHAIWRQARTHPSYQSSAIVFTVFLVSYFVHQLFELDVTITLLFFTIVVAYASSLSCLDQSSERKQIHWGPALCATLLLPFFFYHSVVLPWTSNQTHQVAQARTMKIREPVYQHMLDGSPIGLDYRRILLAEETVKLLYRLPEDSRVQLQVFLQHELQSAKRALHDTLARNPTDLRVSNMLGLLYHVEAQVFKTDSLWDALQILASARRLHANNPQAYYPLAAVFLQQGQTDVAFDLLDQAIALNPAIGESHFKKLVAMKLAHREDEFGALAQQLAQTFPTLQSKIDQLIAVSSEDSTDWLYTMFY